MLIFRVGRHKLEAIFGKEGSGIPAMKLVGVQGNEVGQVGLWLAQLCFQHLAQVIKRNTLHDL